MSAPVFGLIAEFKTPEELVAAAEKARRKGYTRMDAFSPFPVEGLAELVGSRRNYVPAFALLGGITGCLSAFGVQWFSNVVAYPLNVGGRPDNSWPSFVPIAFELTVLFAAIFGLISMFVLNGLPEPYHPVFNLPSFRRGTLNRFFFLILSEDPLFDCASTRKFLCDLCPIGIAEVPREP